MFGYDTPKKNLERGIIFATMISVFQVEWKYEQNTGSKKIL